MTWFEKLMGFPELSPDQVRENCELEGNVLRSRITGEAFIWGSLEMPSLAELRNSVKDSSKIKSELSVEEIIGDAQSLHIYPENAGALFQVASQFNLLEMVHPSVLPEQGVGLYEGDKTQGPACAIAAGAGTIYRNYFVPIKGRTGQTEGNQLDGLLDLGVAFDNTNNRLWKMTNGYVLPTRKGLEEISQRLEHSSEIERDEFRKKLRVGIQKDTQVTLHKSRHTVSQIYCSALPIAYSNLPSTLWEPFAKLILEAAYEATLNAALINSLQNGNNRVFLTLLGGGAFGNDMDWILAALRYALERHRDSGLVVGIVSYRASNKLIRDLIASYSRL